MLEMPSMANLLKGVGSFWCLEVPKSILTGCSLRFAIGFLDILLGVTEADLESYLDTLYVTPV